MRKLALAVCLVALSGAYADGLTPMCGKDSGTMGDIATTVKWYSNDAMTSEEGGAILAAVDIPEGDRPKFSAVICTVPSSQADLSTTLKPANLHGYTRIRTECTVVRRA